ncbi:MAG: oxygen-independent coproporphyrinogen III oxidase [Azospirillaceae bacterium]
MTSDATLRAYAVADVPRYTSYPTAPHFHDGIGAAAYADWLAALPADDPVSVYLHIPFCRQLCWYCGCHTTVPNTYERVARHVGLLCREIALVAERLGGARPLTHLHFGGGSPSYLAATDFARLMRRLGAVFDFQPTAELAIEVDPRELQAPQVAAMAEHGINRVSLGVQDVNEAVQRLINRVQPLSQVAMAVETLRRAGIAGLNADLIYGLPGQTVAHAVRSAEAVAELGFDRIAVFGYAHVPWFKKHQKAIDASLLPGVDTRLAQAAAMAEILTRTGYVAIGLDHFARPDDAMARALLDGRLHRNFQGYTTDRARTLIGFGASAIGAMPSGYVQNEPHLGRYAERLLRGELPVARGVALTAGDRLRRLAIETVMCDMAIDLAATCRAAGEPETALDDALPRLARLAADGLVEMDGRAVFVTRPGRRLVRHVAAAFDAYLDQGQARHSKAV